jgi:hypothetical protein
LRRPVLPVGFPVLQALGRPEWDLLQRRHLLPGRRGGLLFVGEGVLPGRSLLRHQRRLPSGQDMQSGVLRLQRAKLAGSAALGSTGAAGGLRGAPTAPLPFADDSGQWRPRSPKQAPACSISRTALMAPIRAALLAPIAAQNGSANPAGARRQRADALQPHQGQTGPLPHPVPARRHVPQRLHADSRYLHHPVEPARFGHQRPQPRPHGRLQWCPVGGRRSYSPSPRSRTRGSARPAGAPPCRRDPASPPPRAAENAARLSPHRSPFGPRRFRSGWMAGRWPSRLRWRRCPAATTAPPQRVATRSRPR